MTDYTSSIAFTAPSFASRAIMSVKCAYSVWRSRQTLAQLDAYLLEDIGVSLKDAQVEANRTFWDH